MSLSSTKGIGSEFHLQLFHMFRKRTYQLDEYLPNTKKIFLSTGRCSLTYLIKLLSLNRDNEILLPAYLCSTLIEPFLKEKIKIEFYKIKDNLEIDLEDIKKKISKNTRALLIIHYFGFPQPLNKISKICKENSIYLIEDCAQSAFSFYNNKVLGSFGDISLNSYRKFLPVPDGSVLCLNKIDNKYVKIYGSLTHFLYVTLKYFTMILKGFYIRIPFFPKYFSKQSFLLLEGLLERFKKPAKISRISKFLLTRFDFKDIVKKRQRNFDYLLKYLKNIAFYKKLPNNVCPLGFPIIIKDRDSLKRKLIKNKIYPPIHWILPEEINKAEFKNSYNLSNHILTIPIDQRYGEKEMEFIVRVIKDRT